MAKAEVYEAHQQSASHDSALDLACEVVSLRCGTTGVDMPIVEPTHVTKRRSNKACWVCTFHWL